MVMYRNFMEDMMEDLFDEYAPEVGYCTCENCRNDIIACTLNQLPPRYAVTACGNAYAKLNSLEKQYRADAATALIRAAEIVAKSPRHQDAMPGDEDLEEREGLA